MAKILLVEDDNNLREIYEARLQAEGYQIVSAQDGEEALVVAKNEMPDLIISDVMMPKISGFEMLDILRNTDGLKDVKVIMLTALGQSDDQQRADKLGANRYLVKSQVTLEDIVKSAQELLDDSSASANLQTTAEVTEAPVASTTPPAEPSVATTTEEVVTEPPVAQEPVIPPTVSAPVTEPQPAVTPAPIDQPTSSEPPVVEASATQAPEMTVPEVPVADPVVVSEPSLVQQATSPIVEPPVASPQPDPTQGVHDEVMNNAVDSLVSSTPEASSTEQITPASTDLPNDPDLTLPLASATQATEQAGAETLNQEQNTVESQINNFASAPATDPAMVQPSAPSTVSEPAPEVSTEASPQDNPPNKELVGQVSGKKVIVPISHDEDKPDINELLAKEEANQPATTNIAVPTAEAASTPAAPATPDEASPTPSPAAAPATPANANPTEFDPNSIAL